MPIEEVKVTAQQIVAEAPSPWGSLNSANDPYRVTAQQLDYSPTDSMEDAAKEYERKTGKKIDWKRAAANTTEEVIVRGKLVPRVASLLGRIAGPIAAIEFVTEIAKQIAETSEISEIQDTYRRDQVEELTSGNYQDPNATSNRVQTGQDTGLFWGIDSVTTPKGTKMEYITVTAPRVQAQTPRFLNPRDIVDISYDPYYQAQPESEPEPEPQPDPQPEAPEDPEQDPANDPEYFPEPANDPEYYPEPDTEPSPTRRPSPLPYDPWLPEIVPPDVFIPVRPPNIVEPSPEYEPNSPFAPRPNEPLEPPPDKPSPPVADPLAPPFDPQKDGYPEPDPGPNPSPDPSTTPDREGQPSFAPDYDASLSLRVDGQGRIRFRVQRKIRPQRRFKPRRKYRHDKKTKDVQFYRAGLKLINKTYGELDELMDWYDIILDNVSVGGVKASDSPEVLLYITENGFDDTVRIDWEAMVFDWALNNATETLIARMQQLKANAMIDMDMLPGRI